MNIDPCPSEDDYSHDENLKDLGELKEEIKDAWETYDELQQKYIRQTGQKYKWFR